MWIAFEHAAIHERARIAFVGVADDILLRAYRFRDRAPLQPGWVSSTAASAQAAFGDLVDHLARGHLRQRFDQSGVAVCGDIVLNAVRVDYARILQHDLFLPLKERNVGRTNKPGDGALIEAVENRHAVGGFDLLIEHAIAGRDQRTLRAQSHAANALDLAVIFGAAQGDFLIQRILHRLALARQASGSHAHIHSLGEVALLLAFGFCNLIEFFRRHVALSISSGAHGWPGPLLFQPLPGHTPPQAPGRTNPGSGPSAARPSCRRWFPQAQSQGRAAPHRATAAPP